MVWSCGDADWIKRCTMMMEVDGIRQRKTRLDGLRKLWKDLDCARSMHRTGVNGEGKSMEQSAVHWKWPIKQCVCVCVPGGTCCFL